MENNIENDQMINIEYLNNLINLDNKQAILMDGQYYIPLFSEDDYNQCIANAGSPHFDGSFPGNSSGIMHLIHTNKLDDQPEENSSEIILLSQNNLEKFNILNDDHNYQMSLNSLDESDSKLENKDLVDAITLLESLGNDENMQFVVQFEDSILDDPGNSEEIIEEINGPLKSLELSKITGKNLLTGQTVTLNNYLKKIRDSRMDLMLRKKNNNALNDLLHKKLTIGKTLNGQKLVGKIIHVGKKEKGKLEAAKFQDDKEISSSSTNDMVISEYISKALTNLMEIEDISRELKRKILFIEINEKCVENDEIKKSTFQLRGQLELQAVWEDGKYNEKWIFKVVNEDRSLKSTSTLKILIKVVKVDGIVQSTHVGLHPFFEKCPVCYKEFKTVLKLQSHMKTVHDKTRFFCQFCENCFISKHELDKHQQDHVNKKELFSCEKCDKYFLSELQLAKHMLVHDPSGSWKLNCTKCGEVFHSMLNWKKHMLVHTNGRKPYTCVKCTKQFFSIGDLNEHSKLHVLNNRYSCRICNRTFSRYSNLQRHSQVHRVKKSVQIHSCPECGCTYNYVSSLTRHIVQNHLTPS